MIKKKILKWIEKNYKKSTNKNIVPRYEIVRVDGTCPLYNDKHFKLKCNTFCADRFLCQDCKYGDTKEQLIRKIAQAIDIKCQDSSQTTLEQLAEFIVEFLGVEK